MSKKFNLQLFAGDDDIEIPEEFEGIDRDIAIGLMRENGLVEEKSLDNEPTANEPPNNEPTEGANQPTNTTNETEPNGNPAPVKEPETGEDDKGSKRESDEPHKDGGQKTVPYGALADERGKRKAAQREAEALKAELEQLRQQQRQPIVQQPTQTAPPEATPPVDDIIEKAALQLFQQKYGREPDDLERGDNIKLASCTYEVNRNIEAYQAKQQKAAEEARQHAQSYRHFVQQQSQQDDFAEVQAALVEDLKAMSQEERQIFDSAYFKCDQGQGTSQDLFVVKNYWNNSLAKYRKSVEPPEKETEPSKTDPAPPPKPAKKTAEEKLKEIEKQPKASLVKGTNQSSTVNVDEIARLMNEMPWSEFESKYPEYAKLVLES